jgi:uncharacterized secreted protein with C-terminal beta-propeller domain
MKKVISIILCMAMALGVSACGTAPAAETGTPAPTDQAQTENYAYNQAVSSSLTYISDYSVLLDTLKSAANAASDRYTNAAAGGAVSDGTAAADTTESAQSAPETPAAENMGGPDYSGTNVQVEGVDEGDIVKTDGNYIYVISGYELVIFSAAGPDTKEISRVKIGYDDRNEGENDWSYDGKSPVEMYVYGDRVAVISSYYSYHNYEDADGIWQYDNKSYLTVDVYDVSDPAAPTLVATPGQDGSETASRMIGGKLYVISAYYVYNYDENDPATYIPSVYRNGESSVIDAQNVYIMPTVPSTSYAVICVYDIESAAVLSEQTVLGAGDTVYMNDTGLYLAAAVQDEYQSDPYTESVYTVTDYSWRSATEICSFAVSDGAVTPGAVAKVDGSLGNQFYMDEYDGKLRVVTTLSGYNYKIYKDETYGFENYVSGDDFKSSASLYVLDAETMTPIGSVTGLAEGETVYSVRFDGDWAYFCTYETVDPLFAVDVSDPENPVTVSKFEISGFSEYLHVWTDGLLLGLGRETVTNSDGTNTWTGTDGMKLVMFDISDKSNVSAKSVLNIDADWSEALYNHKAILVDYEKNIIGFPAGNGYNIYGWTADRGFFLRGRIETGDWGMGMRGLYIGDYVYVVSDGKLTVLNMSDFILSATLEF